MNLLHPHHRHGGLTEPRGNPVNEVAMRVSCSPQAAEGTVIPAVLHDGVRETSGTAAKIAAPQGDRDGTGSDRWQGLPQVGQELSSKGKSPGVKWNDLTESLPVALDAVRLTSSVDLALRAVWEARHAVRQAQSALA